MRVLYLDQNFVTPSHHGRTRAYEFARRLIANGHEVQVITSPGFLPEKYQHFDKVTKIDIDGISTTIIPIAYSHHMAFSRRYFSFIGFAFRASITCMRTPADVVFATSAPLTIAIPAIAAKLWQRIPMVFEVRDLWPEMPIALGVLRNPVAKLLARWMEWIAYHSAAHVVALSPGMAEGIKQRGIQDDRVSVIPNSCDVDLFDVPEDAGSSIRQELDLEADQPLIVYTGTFGYANKVGYMIEIAYEMAKIHPRIAFLMVGSGTEFDLVIQKALDYNLLHKSVTIWKPVTKKKIPAILSAATATSSWVMNIKEMENNSANKFFDSMAAGKPIIINHGGWQADLLRETGAGISVPPEDAKTAAEMIADFVRDEGRLARARDAARELAYSRFHRDKMYAQFEATLSKQFPTDNMSTH